MGAWLVFLDETGLLMVPLVRRTWAPRGLTPQFKQVMGERKKVSAIGALCVSPERGRVRLYLMFFRDNIDEDLVEYFLRHLMRHLRGPLMLLWDSLGAHKGEVAQEFLAAHGRLRVERFPLYCPELNPMELLWRWVKWDEMANFAPQSVDALEEKASEVARRAFPDQDLLRSFIMECELPLELEELRHYLGEDQ